MTLPRQLGTEFIEGDDSYLPFAVALENGRIDVSRAKIHKPPESAIMVANGTMPDQGGLIEFTDGVGAIDLVGARLSGDGAIINPTPKIAVNDRTDKIEREGFGVLTFPGGDRLRIFAFAIESRRDFTRRGLGSTALVQQLGLEAIDLELVDINKATLTTKSRRPVFSFDS